MDAYTSVSLSPGNWKIVLDHLDTCVARLDHALVRLKASPARTSMFVAREELLGVIEQIRDQL